MKDPVFIAEIQAKHLKFYIHENLESFHGRGISFLVLREVPGLEAQLAAPRFTVYNTDVCFELLGLFMQYHLLMEKCHEGKFNLANWMVPKPYKIHNTAITLAGRTIEKANPGNSQNRTGKMSGTIGTAFRGFENPEVLTALPQPQSYQELNLQVSLYFPDQVRIDLNRGALEELVRTFGNFLGSKIVNLKLEEENGNTVSITANCEGITFTVEPGIQAVTNPANKYQSERYVLKPGYRLGNLGYFLNRVLTPGVRKIPAVKFGNNQKSFEIFRLENGYYAMRFTSNKSQTEFRLSTRSAALMAQAVVEAERFALKEPTVSIPEKTLRSFRRHFEAKSQNAKTLNDSEVLSLIADMLERHGDKLNQDGTDVSFGDNQSIFIPGAGLDGEYVQVDGKQPVISLAS